MGLEPHKFQTLKIETVVYLKKNGTFTKAILLYNKNKSTSQCTYTL